MDKIQITTKKDDESNSKTQQVIYAKSVFDELELVMRISTSSKTSHG